MDWQQELALLRNELQKQAFIPMPGGQPPQDPNAQQAAGPAGMPVDPNTGAPIDPNTGVPIDPAMLQQMAAGAPPQGQPAGPMQGAPMEAAPAGMPQPTGPEVGAAVAQAGLPPETIKAINETVEGAVATALARHLPKLLEHLKPAKEHKGGAGGTHNDPSGGQGATMDAVLEQLSMLNQNLSSLGQGPQQ